MTSELKWTILSTPPSLPLQAKPRTALKCLSYQLCLSLPSRLKVNFVPAFWQRTAFFLHQKWRTAAGNGYEVWKITGSFFPALPVFGHVLLTNFVQEARANFCPLPFGRNKRLGCRLYLLYFFKNGFLSHIIIAVEYTGVFKIVYGIYSPPKFEGQVLLRKK